MLYELDNKLLVINKTLQDLMIAVSYLKYETDLVDQMQNRMNRMYSSIHGLRFDTDSLYEFMWALASEQLNPMIIPPDILRNILQEVQNDIRTNAQLKLPDDPVTKIWSYYGMTKLTPIVLEDYLMLILTIPLVDSSLQMNLYKVHNLPTVHPELKIQATYELEGKYFATLMHEMYVALPNEENIRLCIVSKGHLCLFDQALYPVEEVTWCVYALFLNDLRKIKSFCKIYTCLQPVNLAYSLDGYLWAISALAMEKLQIHCVMNTRFITITPPLEIIDIGNGCEASSSTIYIPAKSELTATMQSVMRSMFFLQYNLKYKNMSQYLVWLQISFATLTEDEKQTLQNKLKFVDSMPMQEFEKELKSIDTKYPFSVPTGMQLSVQIVVGLFLLAVLIVGLWLYCRHKSRLQGLWQLPSKVPDLLHHDLGPISKLFECPNPEPPIPPPIHVIPTMSTDILHPTYRLPIKCTPNMMPPPPSTSSIHSDDFNVTSLDETAPPVTPSECAKKKSTLDYVQQAALQLYKQDRIPWKQYTRHLKKKQRPAKTEDPIAPMDAVDDSDQVTPL